MLDELRLVVLEQKLSEKCYRIYEMLRLRMELYPEVPLEVSGAPGVGQALCVREPLSTQRPENTNKRDLTFRALLTEDGAERLGLFRT
jgi:hypothetical protein